MPTRRDFLKLGSVGVAGLVAAPPAAPGAADAAETPRYPLLTIAPLKDIGAGAAISFAYPDRHSPAMLLRLATPAVGGVGPNQEIVAYWKMLICPCHWSTFDPAKAGTLVIGQASQHLPQIELRVDNGLVQAVGVAGLIYGRHTNIV